MFSQTRKLKLFLPFLRFNVQETIPKRSEKNHEN